MLLVDADTHSIEQIREALMCLRGEGGEVRAKLFGPPGRAENKKWARFLREPNITFRPVLRPDRRSDRSSEPNDEAISAAMQVLSTSRAVDRIALLTSDAGFVGTILKL